VKRIIAVLALAALVAGCGPSKKKVLLAGQKKQFGATKLAEGKAEDALADLTEAHKLDPKDPEIAHLLGMAYWSKARLVGDESMKLDAEKYVLLSFKLKKKDVPGDWHNNLGALYVDMKRYPDAIKELELAIKDPEYRTPERPNNNIAEAYLMQGDYAKAKEYADKALRIQPRFCMALTNRGKACEGLKQYEEALKAQKDAIAECPEYPEPYLHAGLMDLKLGKLADARTHWTTAKKLDPDGKVGKEAEQYLRTLGH